MPVEPEPVPVEPVPVEPEPVPAEPEPVPVESEHGTVDADAHDAASELPLALEHDEVAQVADAEPTIAPRQSAPAQAPAGSARRRPSAAGARATGMTPAATQRGARRSLGARLAAVVALLAAIVAVVLLAHALGGSGQTKTVAAPTVIKLLIPEGKTRAQIAEIAAKAGLSGSYRVASRRSPLLNPSSYGAPHGTATLEGFLFPATYDVTPGEPTSRLVQEQLIAFRENFGLAEINSAHALHVTPYAMLTVASMIEREAQLPADRAKIAAVIYNRLRQGIPLGIDATIYYAVEQRAGIPTYTGELTEAQLHIESRYNTRTHVGLPPTPISNPGAASIHAAAHPANAPYLYYVAGADGCGEQVFSTTAAAFEANVAAYQAAVQKNGGHPPACTHG